MILHRGISDPRIIRAFLVRRTLLKRRKAATRRNPSARHSVVVMDTFFLMCLYDLSMILDVFFKFKNRFVLFF
jgi:hypothetical protein